MIVIVIVCERTHVLLANLLLQLLDLHVQVGVLALELLHLVLLLDERLAVPDCKL